MNTPDHLAYDAHRIIGDVAASIRSANASLHVTSHRTKEGWAEQLEAALTIMTRPITGEPTRAPDRAEGGAAAGELSIDDVNDLTAGRVVVKQPNDSGKSARQQSNGPEVASEGLEPVSTLHGLLPGNCGLEADTYTMPAEVASALCGPMGRSGHFSGPLPVDTARPSNVIALDPRPLKPGEIATIDYGDAAPAADPSHDNGELPRRPRSIIDDIRRHTPQTLDPTPEQARTTFASIADSPLPSTVAIREMLLDIEREARWIGGDAHSWGSTWTNGPAGLDGAAYAVLMRDAAMMIDRLGVELVAQDRRFGEAWANRDAAEKASRKALDDLAFVKGEHARLERANGELNRTLANMTATPVRYTDDQRAVARVALTRAHGDYHPTPADYGMMVDAVAGAFGMVRAGA